MHDPSDLPEGQAARPRLAAVSAAVQRFRLARTGESAVPFDWTGDAPAGASAGLDLGGSVADPIWEPQPDRTTTPEPVAPLAAWDAGLLESAELAAPRGRMRRLVGSSTAVLALGVALGAGFVTTGATAGTPGDPTPEPGTAAAADPTLTDQYGDVVDDPTGDDAGEIGEEPVDEVDPGAAGADVEEPDTLAPENGVTVDPGTGDDAKRGVQPSRSADDAPAATPTKPVSKPTVKLKHKAKAKAKKAKPKPKPKAKAKPKTARATSSRVLPTPAQISGFVRATKVTPLPAVQSIDHRMAVRMVMTGKRAKVAWPFLAAVAKWESDLGRDAGALAGRHLSAAQFSQFAWDQNRNGKVRRREASDSLASVAGFLRSEGATRTYTSTKAWKKALRAYFGTEAAANRVGALAAFYGALGTGGLQNGLRWQTTNLRRQVLTDPRVTLSGSTRDDVAKGRVDTRSLMSILYLANGLGSVEISSLVSGHRLFTTSGNVSAHVYGRAVDVAAVGGTRISSATQGAGSVTERAVRMLLMLPEEVRPRQVISLMDVDGPTGNTGSFALSDHDDHIHLGY